MRKLTYDQVKSVEGIPSRDAARILGVGKSTINDARAALRTVESFESIENAAPRILTIDIESRPHLAYVWGLWDQNIGIDFIKEHGGMMCFAAKWLGDEEILFYSDFQHGRTDMLQAVWDLLNDADIVITYNGDRYDFKRINNEFLEVGLTPPSPYRSIDLIKTNRQQFDLASRKLDYIAQYVGVGSKVKHEGFGLWLDCMAGDEDAWARMEEYNRGDVTITEGVYLKILPWIKNAPHMGLWTGVADCCPWCAGTKLERMGNAYAGIQSYPLYQCKKCGGWIRSTERLGTPLKTRAAR